MPLLFPMEYDQEDGKPECIDYKGARDFFSYYRNFQQSISPQCPRKCKRMTYDVVPFFEESFTDSQSIMVTLIIPSAEVSCSTRLVIIQGVSV